MEGKPNDSTELPENIHFTNIKYKTQWNWPEVKRLRLKAKHS